MHFLTLLRHPAPRRLFWFAGVLIALGILATLALPSLIKSQVESRGTALLGRALTVGSVQFRPWALELTVSDVRLAGMEGRSDQVAIGRVSVDVAMASVWNRAPVLDAITIEQLQVRLDHAGGGHYDIDDLLQRFKPDPSAPPSEPVRFALHNVVLKDGSVDFTDHVAGAERTHTLRKLNIALPFVSNMEVQRDVSVQPHLAFELNGSRFDSSAVATPFAKAPKGELTLQLSHLDLAPYLPYLPAGLPVRVKGAVLDSTLKVVFAQKPVQTVQLSGTVQASGVRVDDAAGAPLVAIGSVEADVTDFRPLEHSLTLGALRIKAPVVSLRRNPAGQWVLPGASGGQAAGLDAAQATTATSAAAAVSGAGSAHVDWNFGLDKLALTDGEVRLKDESVSPAAPLALNKIEMDVRGVQWPFVHPAQLEVSAGLQSLPAGKGKAADFHIKGEGTDAAGVTHVRLSNLALSLAAPYIRPYFLPQVEGALDGEATAQWKGADVQVGVARMALRDVTLSPPANGSGIVAKELPSVRSIELGQVAVDLSQRSAVVGKVAVRGAKVRVARDADGQWMFSRWLAPAATATSNAGKGTGTAGVSASGSAAPWAVKLVDVAVDDAALTYVDRMPDKTVFLELSALQAAIKDLVPDGKKPMGLILSAKVRGARTDPGSLRFDGSVMWDPVVAQGTLVASQLPVQAVAPYAMHALRLDLLRADTGFKGQFRYAELPTGVEVQVRADVAVEELRLNSFNLPGDAPQGARNGGAATGSASAAATETEELLSWKALSVPGVEFSMAPGAPMRLKVREVSLSDFFARLIISPQGRLVLQDIVRSEDIGPAAQGAAGTAAAHGTAATANALEPLIDIGPIKLVNGRVAFSDRFIKPNYSASLTDLSGGLSRFSSTQPQGEVQMADLELRGRAEGTARLEVSGKVNPLAKPLALDISGRVRDLELSPLSSYAIKYAGYGIERGKLSVDVAYNVAPDGRLLANNKIVLNQLVFGDEVAGAANRLPVKLAVALLADRNGVIDLDLPVSGSLNDPEFRVWPVVWKIVGNIVAKALTSPFHLVSGLFSGADDGADELSSVAFVPGTTRIALAGRQRLDAVAQALTDKPALRLTVVGTAHLEREQADIRRERLNGMLLAEKRRAAASAGKDVTAVADVTADEAPALLKDVYRRADIKKPRNLVGLAKDLAPSEMEALLMGSFVVNEDTIRELALNRGVAVREYLTARQLPSERLFLGASKTTEGSADWQPRAELNIEHP